MPWDLNGISMLDNLPDPIFEEEIFPACNLDSDCDTIGRLLYEYGEFHDLKNAKTFLERRVRL